MKASKNILTNQSILEKKYIVKKEIGYGSTSKVVEVLDSITDEIKVAKIYNNNYTKGFENEKNIFMMIQELDLQTNIKVYEYGTDDLTIDGKSEKAMFAILEYGNHGTLFDALKNINNGFSEDICQYILLNILNAVEALHKKGICHRDLKLENLVFVGDNYELKLIDFGFSAKFLTKKNQKKKLSKKVGTPFYIPPEIFENKLYYDGEKVDIFSLGVILFTLMTKNFPFEKINIGETSNNDQKILHKYLKEKQYDKYWKTIDEYLGNRNLPQKFKNLFVKIVAYNPEERPSIEEIKKDEWMLDIVDASEEKLNYLKNKMINQIMK